VLGVFGGVGNLTSRIKSRPRAFSGCSKSSDTSICCPADEVFEPEDDAATCEFWGEELLDEDAVPDEHAPRAKTRAVPKENTESLRIKSPYR